MSRDDFVFIEEDNQYNGINNGAALSALLTTHLREISNDKHIFVVFGARQQSIDISAAIGAMAGLPAKKIV